MEIKSKFANKDRVIYGQSTCVIIQKRYDSNVNEWFYEVENRLNRFKAWVKENHLIKTQ